MAKDHDHTASKSHPRKPETHGAQRPRINSAYTPYGVAALGSIGSGTFLGGAGGGPGQPQAVHTAGGVSNGWVASASQSLSGDQFPSPVPDMPGDASNGSMDQGVDPTGGPSAGIVSQAVAGG